MLVSQIDTSPGKKVEAYLKYLGRRDLSEQVHYRYEYMDALNRLSHKGPWLLSVLVMNLNGLPQINDEHNFARDDVMLRCAGGVLRTVACHRACARREGGDNLTMPPSGLDKCGAQTTIDRIYLIPKPNSRFYSSHKSNIAIDMATCILRDQLEATLIQTDRAMYAEKPRYHQNSRSSGAGMPAN